MRFVSLIAEERIERERVVERERDTHTHTHTHMYK